MVCAARERVPFGALGFRFEETRHRIRGRRGGAESAAVETAGDDRRDDGRNGVGCVKSVWHGGPHLRVRRASAGQRQQQHQEHEARNARAQCVAPGGLSVVASGVSYGLRHEQPGHTAGALGIRRPWAT